MTLKPQPSSGVNGPLWLIAFSLLTIAICMVFLVIEKQVAEPKSSPQTDSSIKTPPPSPRPERLRLSPGSSPRRAESFGHLASSQGSGTSLGEPGLPTEPANGFFPTTPAPLPGRYLPALPRIIDQPNYRTVVKGRVTLKGTPPPEKETPVPADYPCPPPEPPVLRTRYFLVGTNSGLANTVVQLVGDYTRTFQVADVTNELVFADCRLEPAFSVVLRGQQLRVRDALGLSHVLDEVEIPPEESVLLRARVRADLPVTMTCKTHPWEQAQVWYQSPAALPFTITDGNGAFSLTNVPPGDYTLLATHWSGPQAQRSSQKLIVRGGRTNSVDLIIQAPAPETAARF